MYIHKAEFAIDVGQFIRMTVKIPCAILLNSKQLDHASDVERILMICANISLRQLRVNNLVVLCKT